MASAVSALRSTPSHVHLVGAKCPLCDQPIPNEKAQEVQARLEAKEREVSESVTTRLKDQFAAERVQIEATARADGAKSAQAVAQTEIDKLKQTNTDQALAAQERIKVIEQANVEARTAAKQRIAEADRLKAEAEAAARDKVAAAEAAKAAAEATAKTVQEEHEARLNERLQEQRDAMEHDKTAALNARDAKHFEDNQKLKDKVDDLQRKLDKKTANEIGEGGEVDLFEELKAHFEGDRIRRVPKGTPGADIIHEIWEDGRLCGKIVYDSKKRASWKSEYATKLCEDKIAEGADHAILSLMKFPADCRQLEVRDGVILANPARILVLGEILRDHIVRSYGLRLSNEEREKKTHELYAYIMSERFTQLVDAIEKKADKLLDIDVAEERAHRKVWETRGGLLKALQKVHANLRADVARIVGTSDAVE